MKTDDLIGLFVIGTTKQGAQFLGLVERVEGEYLYLKQKDATKIVAISEIAELKAEKFKEQQ